MLGKIIIILGVLLLLVGLYILRHQIIKKRRKRNQAAFDIVKEEALCNALTNQVLEKETEEKRYHLEDKMMLQILTKQAKKRIDYIFSLENVIIFGRNPKTSDVCLKDPLVSGRHCTIFKNQEGVWKIGRAHV